MPFRGNFVLFFPQVPNLLRAERHRVLDRLPLDVCKHRVKHRYRIGKDEQWEREHADDLHLRRSVDVLALGDAGDAADEPERHHGAEQPGHDREDADVHIGRARHNAGHRHDRVEDQRRAGQDEARDIVHDHVKAGEAAVHKHLFEHPEAVAAENLQIALDPARALHQRLAELRRLLVVDHGAFAVADRRVVQDAVDGELEILGQQKVLPAAVLAGDARAEQEARARNAAARAEHHARPVELRGLAQEKQRVARADPVVAEVLRVAVARDDLVARIKDLVHLLDEVFVEDVVRVEHKEALKGMLAVLLKDGVQQELQRVALADGVLVLPLEHDGARRPRDRRGAVRAVVRHDEDVHKLRGVRLPAHALNELRDDGLLIAGRDQHGVAVVLLRREHLLPAEQGNSQINRLVRIARHEQDGNDEIDVGKRFHDRRHLLYALSAARRRTMDLDFLFQKARKVRRVFLVHILFTDHIIRQPDQRNNRKSRFL